MYRGVDNPRCKTINSTCFSQKLLLFDCFFSFPSVKIGCVCMIYADQNTCFFLQDFDLVLERSFEAFFFNTQIKKLVCCLKQAKVCICRRRRRRWVVGSLGRQGLQGLQGLYSGLAKGGLTKVGLVKGLPRAQGALESVSGSPKALKIHFFCLFVF